jgi:hypothetical protein
MYFHELYTKRTFKKIFRLCLTYSQAVCRMIRMAESRMVRMAASRLLRKVDHRNRSDRCSRGSVDEGQLNTRIDF